jgi:hypothetical protein
VLTEGEVAMRLKTLCEQLLDLPTDGHEPWLRADWQVRFGLIANKGEATLSGLRSQLE